MRRCWAITAVICLSVALHAAEANNIALTWVKVSGLGTIAGSFTRTVDGIEIYSFHGKLCMVTYGPKSDATGDTVVLPATEGSEWSFTKNGIVVVSPSAVLARPVYFALVRWTDGEGLIRIQSVDEVPPDQIPSRLLDLLVYRKERLPNKSPEATPGSVTPAASAPGAPPPSAPQL
jgi:hypothetical protein